MSLVAAFTEEQSLVLIFFSFPNSGRSKINCTDVGWNPRWPIFHERSRSHDEHEEHEGKTWRGTQENHSNWQNDHTYARSSKHKRRYKIHDQQRTIQRVTGSSPWGGLDGGLPREEVLNPKGSSPKRGRGLSQGVDSMWMSKALSLNELLLC